MTARVTVIATDLSEEMQEVVLDSIQEVAYISKSTERKKALLEERLRRKFSTGWRVVLTDIAQW
ncbi:unnamed protein product [Dicrocoelium dendriticum]|nr:unnamed protein product [Dicrocoelium dendriticum]